MKENRKSYYKKEWYDFSEIVKQRDGYKCLKCGRKSPDVILQVHHKIYKPNLELWKYPTSDCITLCKGCHANEHGIIEPDRGWILISIEDLGEMNGICERNGCGHEIRYEHLTYHPRWGYMIVGSTCVEHLTREDQFLSHEVIKTYKRISEFTASSYWDKGFTNNGNEYIFTTHSHHQIRIYGKENFYSYQIGLKEKGISWFDYKKIIHTKNKNLEQVKELSYIVLRGLTTESESEKEILRGIYRSIK